MITTTPVLDDAMPSVHGSVSTWKCLGHFFRLLHFKSNKERPFEAWTIPGYFFTHCNYRLKVPFHVLQFWL